MFKINLKTILLLIILFLVLNKKNIEKFTNENERCEDLTDDCEKEGCYWDDSDSDLSKHICRGLLCTDINFERYKMYDNYKNHECPDGEVCIKMMKDLENDCNDDDYVKDCIWITGKNTCVETPASPVPNKVKQHPTNEQLLSVLKKDGHWLFPYELKDAISDIDKPNSKTSRPYQNISIINTRSHIGNDYENTIKYSNVPNNNTLAPYIYHPKDRLLLDFEYLKSGTGYLIPMSKGTASGEAFLKFSDPKIDNKYISWDVHLKIPLIFYYNFEGLDEIDLHVIRLEKKAVIDYYYKFHREKEAALRKRAKNVEKYLKVNHEKATELQIIEAEKEAAFRERAKGLKNYLKDGVNWETATKGHVKKAEEKAEELKVFFKVGENWKSPTKDQIIEAELRKRARKIDSSLTWPKGVTWETATEDQIIEAEKRHFSEAYEVKNYLEDGVDWRKATKEQISVANKKAALRERAKYVKKYFKDGVKWNKATKKQILAAEDEMLFRKKAKDIEEKYYEKGVTWETATKKQFLAAKNEMLFRKKAKNIKEKYYEKGVTWETATKKQFLEADKKQTLEIARFFQEFLPLNVKPEDATWKDLGPLKILYFLAYEDFKGSNPRLKHEELKKLALNALRLENARQDKKKIQITSKTNMFT